MHTHISLKYSFKTKVDNTWEVMLEVDFWFTWISSTSWECMHRHTTHMYHATSWECMHRHTHSMLPHRYACIDRHMHVTHTSQTSPSEDHSKQRPLTTAQSRLFNHLLMELICCQINADTFTSRGRQRTWIQIISMSLKDSDQEIFVYFCVDGWIFHDIKMSGLWLLSTHFTACQDPWKDPLWPLSPLY